MHWSSENYEAKQAERIKKLEEAARKPHWWWLGQTDPLARYTAYLAVFTAALVLVALLQFVAALFTWWEIHTGSDDTKALVSANQNQLKVMQAEQRPWVSIGNLNGIGISSPLQFDPEKGALLTVQYTLRNTGKSPALHANFRSRLVSLPHAKFMHEEFADAQDALCEPLRSTDQMLLNLTVFPGDVISGSEGIGMTKEQIRSALMAREFGPFAHKGFVSLALIACIDYQLPFEKGHHQTRYAFELGVPMDNGAWMGDLKPEGTRSDVKLIYFNQSAD